MYSGNYSREAGNKVDQYRKQQRVQRPAAQQRDTEDGIVNDDDYDEIWPIRLPTSTRRYHDVPDVRTESGRKQADSLPLTSQRYSAPGNTRTGRSAIPPRRTSTQTSIAAMQGNRIRDTHTDDIFSRNTVRDSDYRQRSRFHWLVFVGLAMIIMIVGWFAFSALGNWWQVTQDDWHYGRPRTFQIDAVVGHNDSATNPSHFIAINLNRHILIIELPGGDPSKARIF